MNRPYYFEMGRVGRAVYALTNVPIRRTLTPPQLNDGNKLGDNPEEIAGNIAQRLPDAVQVPVIIYTKTNRIPLSKGHVLSIEPLDGSTLEQIIGLVAQRRPDITILRETPN